MLQQKRKYFLISFSFLILLLPACTSRKQENILFRVLNKDRTGLDFNNKLTYTQELNLFKYMYFYNGAGVGAGDFNNDGRIDLFFTSNQGENKLYLNSGNLHFTDV